MGQLLPKNFEGLGVQEMVAATTLLLCPGAPRHCLPTLGRGWGRFLTDSHLWAFPMLS